jgi:hypothetical protein
MTTKRKFINRKTNSFLLLLVIAFTGIVTMRTAKAQTYDPLAVQRINDLIANNGLKATPNAPETWEFAEWNDETPKMIIKLMLQIKFMKGDASFSGLTTLQVLCCDFGYLTKLDLTNCPQLQELYCMDNYLTEIILTNSNQLQRIKISKNKLTKFDVTNYNKLYELECYMNFFTELDVRNCAQLKILGCSNNRLTELDVTSCTQLESIGCYGNKLIELDLKGLDKLWLSQYCADDQTVSLTLYKNEIGGYSFPINLNSPVFDNSKISYENGILKSKDSTVVSSSFIVQTNKDGFTLSGTMVFNYSDETGISTIDSGRFNIYPNPTTGELRVESGELRVESVEVYDMEGKKQKAESSISTSLNAKKQETEREIVIDISHLPAGVYLVKTVTEQGEIVKKIVKQ